MSNITEFTQALASDLFESEELFPVDFDQAWVWLGYSRKDAAKRNFSKCGFVENVDYQIHTLVESAPVGGLTHREDIKLSAECFKVWGMMSGTPTPLVESKNQPSF